VYYQQATVLPLMSVPQLWFKISLEKAGHMIHPWEETWSHWPWGTWYSIPGTHSFYWSSVNKQAKIHSWCGGTRTYIHWQSSDLTTRPPYTFYTHTTTGTPHGSSIELALHQWPQSASSLRPALHTNHNAAPWLELTTAGIEPQTCMILWRVTVMNAVIVKYIA